VGNFCNFHNFIIESSCFVHLETYCHLGSEDDPNNNAGWDALILWSYFTYECTLVHTPCFSSQIIPPFPAQLYNSCPCFRNSLWLLKVICFALCIATATQGWTLCGKSTFLSTNFQHIIVFILLNSLNLPVGKGKQAEIKSVDIEGCARTPFTLAMGETYNIELPAISGSLQINGRFFGTPTFYPETNCLWFHNPRGVSNRH